MEHKLENFKYFTFLNQRYTLIFFFFFCRNCNFKTWHITIIYRTSEIYDPIYRLSYQIYNLIAANQMEWFNVITANLLLALSTLSPFTFFLQLFLCYIMNYFISFVLMVTVQNIALSLILYMSFRVIKNDFEIFMLQCIFY